MVHKQKKKEEKDPIMKSYDEEFRKMGIPLEEESEEDWLEKQRKDYEKQAKEFVGMYKKAENIARQTKRALQKGRAFVQERLLHKEPTRRPIKVYLEEPKKKEKEIVYGEW
jgi:hypothetical protein